MIARRLQRDALWACGAAKKDRRLSRDRCHARCVANLGHDRETTFRKRRFSGERLGSMVLSATPRPRKIS
jgi:hypothetical protein